MSKDHKLKRYRRKDYSEIVDFPVEIVGRDGVVRQYGFEQSVQLYQRRHSFAPMRFPDHDLVEAEQGHCKARIEQLRRSYFHLHGWVNDGAGPNPEEVHADVAGELAAFLNSALPHRDRLRLGFTRLDAAGPATVWFVAPAHVDAGLLLYVYAFGPHAPAESQRAFMRDVRALQVPSLASGDAERMIAYQHASDCAFVLTGRSAEVAHLAASSRTELDGEDTTPSAWDEVVDFTRRGDLPAAYLRCKTLIEEQPWHRDAYMLGATLAVHMRRPEEADDVAFVGTRYFPDDPWMWATRAFAQLHVGQLAAAEASLRRVRSGSTLSPWAASLFVVIAARRWRWDRAVRQCLDRDVARRGADATAWRAISRLVVRITSLAAVAFGCSALALAAGWASPTGLRITTVLLCFGWLGVAAVWARRRWLAVEARLLLDDPQEALHRVRQARAARAAWARGERSVSETPCLDGQGD